MTISVGELFDTAELLPAGVVQWGKQVELDRPGVYIVASTPALGDRVGRLGTYQPDPRAFDTLRSRCPSVAVDGAPATNDKMAERIGAFWIPESAVLYIGLAGTSVRKRVNQYYSTRIGHRSPHAGGWWLKTLADLDALYVHYAAAESPKSAEARLLNTFAATIQPPARRVLHDPERIAPFANIEVQAGIRKRHGMTGYKNERANATTSPISATRVGSSPAPDSNRAPGTPMPEGRAGPGTGTRIESQVITDKDRAGSNLRIPARSKSALPAADGYLEVSYQDRIVKARWRVNGSRSGTIGLGRKIMSSIEAPGCSVWMWVKGTSIVIED